jgi:hypothetical protein
MAQSYIGTRVRLLRDLVTRGGTTFKKGVIMYCYDSTSSGLKLTVRKRGWTQTITDISKYDVEVVEGPRKKED